MSTGLGEQCACEKGNWNNPIWDQCGRHGNNTEIIVLLLNTNLYILNFKSTVFSYSKLEGYVEF